MSTTEVIYSFTRRVHIDELDHMWACWRIEQQGPGWRHLLTRMGFDVPTEGET